MQVSPFLASFKLLHTGDFLLILRTLRRICQSKLSQKLTAQKASMAPVSDELGATLKRAKSQRMKEIEPHMQADEEKTKPLKYCLDICLLWQQRGKKQLGKNLDILENSIQILLRKRSRQASDQKENTDPDMTVHSHISTEMTEGESKGPEYLLQK